LDFNYSYTTNPLDKEVFTDSAAYYLREYHKHMIKLNIQQPTYFKCATQYIDQIIQFIQGLIEKNLAYEKNSSIYLHKLSKLHEGEGALTTAQDNNSEKENSDDLLWCKKQSGEPFWPSPWGEGRPTIYSTYALRCIRNSGIVIFSGKVNQELIHYDIDNVWYIKVGEFKTSESLTNALKIEEAFQKFTPSQIRLLLLLNNWSTTFNYCQYELDKALNYEKTINMFLMNIKEKLGLFKQSNNLSGDAKFDGPDSILNDDFLTAEEQIHLALCDSIDTKTVMEIIHQLITKTNAYIYTTNLVVNHHVLMKIVDYITHLMDIFGLKYSSVYHDMISASSIEK
jgi:cysteinyl-tRNA synthetase